MEIFRFFFFFARGKRKKEEEEDKCYYRFVLVSCMYVSEGKLASLFLLRQCSKWKPSSFFFFSLFLTNFILPFLARCSLPLPIFPSHFLAFCFFLPIFSLSSQAISHFYNFEPRFMPGNTRSGLQVEQGVPRQEVTVDLCGITRPTGNLLYFQRNI